MEASDMFCFLFFFIDMAVGSRIVVEKQKMCFTMVTFKRGNVISRKSYFVLS